MIINNLGNMVDSTNKAFKKCVFLNELEKMNLSRRSKFKNIFVFFYED